MKLFRHRAAALKPMGGHPNFSELLVEARIYAAVAQTVKRWIVMEPVKSNRGFASMDPARQREIASKGGHGVPPEKRSFSKNRQLAAAAGKKGGEAVPAGERSFSQNRELAAAAGRKGGESRAMLFSTMGHKRRRGQNEEEDEEKEQAEETEPADAND